VEDSLPHLFNVCSVNAFDFERAIENLKRYISLAIDQIPAKLIQLGDGTVHCELRNFINSFWNKEELPQQRKESIIVPMYEKGDKRVYNNCRGLRVFEDGVLRKMFWPKRDEVTGEWRRLHNEELHNLYSLSNIIRVIKSRRMESAKHVTLLGRGEERCIRGFVRKLREREHFEHRRVGLDVSLILKWIFMK
jgi:hypothetical protein